MNTLFSDFRKPITLRDGTVVEIREGKTRHFGLLLRLFETAINNMSPGHMGRLLKIIADKQIISMSKGMDPLDIDPDKAADALSTEEGIKTAVEEVLGTGSLLASFMHTVWDLLPEIVESLTNITGARWLDLDPDESLPIVFSIVAVNYDFFFRNLPQMSAAFGGMLQARAAEMEEKPAK